MSSFLQGRLFWKFLVFFFLAQVTAVIGTGLAIWAAMPAPSPSSASLESARPGFFPEPPPPHARGAQGAEKSPPPVRPLKPPLLHLLAGTIVSLIFAALLAAYVARPVRRLRQALQAGADGYLLKTVESDQLIETIFKVLDGESVVSPEMLTKLVAVFRARPPAVAPVATTGGETSAVPAAADGDEDLLADLSPREREILLLIARGDSNKLIARELDIAETTVKIHVQHILRKLGLSSRVQAAVYASSRGLV